MFFPFHQSYDVVLLLLWVQNGAGIPAITHVLQGRRWRKGWRRVWPILFKTSWNSHTHFLHIIGHNQATWSRKLGGTCLLESESEVSQLCPTLCHPMDCSLQHSSVHGIFQARVLEWVAISFFRGSSQPRDRTWVSCIAGRCFTIWATREVQHGFWPVAMWLSGNWWARKRKLFGGQLAISLWYNESFANFLIFWGCII